MSVRPFRSAQTWASLGMAAMLAACSSLSASPKSPLPDDAAALAGLAANYSPEEVNKCLQLPLADQTRCRDTIIQAMMAAIDLRYADFELGMFDANRYGNFGATLATLGLTTAGSLSGGGVARALSAAAAGLTGTREAFNRDVLVDHTVVALQASMQARRNEAAFRIREGLKRPAEMYPLGVALSDAYAYFRGGTLVGALVSLTESASNRASDARDALDDSAMSRAPLERFDPVAALGAPSQAATAGGAGPIRLGRPARQILRGLDTGVVAAALRGWIASAGTAALRRDRRADIEREAQNAGYDRTPIDAQTFIADPRPSIAPLKARVAQTLMNR